MTLHSAPLILFCVFLAAVGVTSIRVTSLVVPHQVGRGQDARLHCHFNLEGHKLYSVKWFKGSHEFFRVVPDATRPVRAFPLQELTVETQQSNASSYQPGEWVSLNCTSSPSNPIAILQWYIDGKLAPSQYVKRYVDGSSLESVPSKQQHWQQSLSVRSSEEGWQSRSTAVPPDYQQHSAIVELEFMAELPLGPPVGPFAIRNATCTAYVGDIYKSDTHVNLVVVDSRYSSPSFFGGNSKRPAPITFRPPSHLQSNGALGLSSGRDSDVNIKIGGRIFLSSLVSLLVGAVLTPPLSTI